MQYETEPSPPAEKLPMRIEPMMLTHLALTGDVTQHREWRARIESILQMQAIEHTQDPEAKRLLARERVWRRVRITGKTGALSGMVLASGWMAWLLPTYAIGHGFGWLAAASYLLPVPIAWKLARRLWEKASLYGMKDLGTLPTRPRRMAMWPRAMMRSAIAGFGFGFTLIFLQGLVSAFMTPLPTVSAELMADAWLGLVAGFISGGLSTLLTPLVSRPPP
jgi:hypothetical protein